MFLTFSFFSRFSPQVVPQVLESLWNIARREGTSKEQVESALEKHARLLEKVAYKRREEFTLNYARRCIEDIRNVSLNE